jgi:hypothetical protein
MNGCSQLWTALDFSSLRSSTPLWKAECIYRHTIKEMEMELTRVYILSSQTYHHLSLRSFAFLLELLPTL